MTKKHNSTDKVYTIFYVGFSKCIYFTFRASLVFYNSWIYILEKFFEMTNTYDELKFQSSYVKLLRKESFYWVMILILEISPCTIYRSLLSLFLRFPSSWKNKKEVNFFFFCKWLTKETPPANKPGIRVKSLIYHHRPWKHLLYAFLKLWLILLSSPVRMEEFYF